MPQIILPVRQLTALHGTWLQTTSSGDKGTLRQAHQVLFSGVDVWTPLYHPQGKGKNISYGCGPRGHLTHPFH